MCTYCIHRITTTTTYARKTHKHVPNHTHVFTASPAALPAVAAPAAVPAAPAAVALAAPALAAVVDDNQIKISPVNDVPNY